MAIKVERQIVVSIEGFPNCEWRVSNSKFAEGTTFGAVDVLRRIDNRAAARPPARSG